MSDVQELATRKSHFPATRAPTKSARPVEHRSGWEMDLREEELPGTMYPVANTECAETVPSLL